MCWIIVSIHAPAGGATGNQSNLPVGFSVSIHAPAGGATNRGTATHSIPQCFNPRARRGRDFGAQHRKALFLQFQSTRPQGARPK